jgi:hypothetical protein
MLPLDLDVGDIDLMAYPWRMGSGKVIMSILKFIVEPGSLGARVYNNEVEMVQWELAQDDKYRIIHISNITYNQIIRNQISDEFKLPTHTFKGCDTTSNPLAISKIPDPIPTLQLCLNLSLLQCFL